MCENFTSGRKIEHAIVELPEKTSIKIIAEIILSAMDIDVFRLARSSIFRFFHAFSPPMRNHLRASKIFQLSTTINYKTDILLLQ